MKRPVIAVTMGDPSGNGPELCIKALASGRYHDIADVVVVGDVHALELAAEIGSDDELKKSGDAVRDYLYSELESVPGLRLFGKTGNMELKIPLFSFCIDGVHHEDLALILDKMGIAVRSGQMCAEPLMDRFGVSGMLRVSLAPYNTMQEAEYFVKSLYKAAEMLRR